MGWNNYTPSGLVEINSGMHNGNLYHNTFAGCGLWKDYTSIFDASYNQNSNKKVRKNICRHFLLPLLAAQQNERYRSHEEVF
jgi:hypothetical protein